MLVATSASLFIGVVASRFRRPVRPKAVGPWRLWGALHVGPRPRCTGGTAHGRASRSGERNAEHERSRDSAERAQRAAPGVHSEGRSMEATAECAAPVRPAVWLCRSAGRIGRAVTPCGVNRAAHRLWSMAPARSHAAGRALFGVTAGVVWRCVGLFELMCCR